MGGSADPQINPHAVAAPPADELIDGHTVRLSLDVPQRRFDSADRRVEHRPAGKPRAVVHQPPQVFDPGRILSDQPVFEVLHRLLDRVIGPDAVRLADAVQMLVGHHLDEDVIPAAQIDAERLDVGDFHIALSSPLAA